MTSRAGIPPPSFPARRQEREDQGQNRKGERCTVNGTLRKRCPKCGGKVLLDKDYHGWYQECLQCGYTCDLQVVLEKGAWQEAGRTAALPTAR